MRYAIIQTGGKQYKVSEGEEILVDKLNPIDGEKITFDKVLLIRTDDTTEVGLPYVAKGRVTGKILEKELKGEKLDVYKFKAKVHYRRKMGFRPRLTKILIEKIELNGEKKEVKKEPTAKKPTVKKNLTGVKK